MEPPDDDDDDDETGALTGAEAGLEKVVAGLENVVVEGLEKVVAGWNLFLLPPPKTLNCGSLLVAATARERKRRDLIILENAR